MDSTFGVNMKGIKILIHASAWFAPFLVPMVCYLVIKDQEIQRLSLQALIFQPLFLFLLFISSVLSIILVGLPLLLIFGAIYILTPIIGIVYAITDRTFQYPIVKWFIR